MRATGKDIIRFARHADRLSWDWLTVPEHLFMPDGQLTLGYAPAEVREAFLEYAGQLKGGARPPWQPQAHHR